MSTVSSFESSLLALVAENPNISAAELDDLMKDASPKVKELIQAIVDVASNNVQGMSDPLHTTAQRMLEWARANRVRRKVSAR
jgi:hypothetical protein